MAKEQDEELATLILIFGKMLLDQYSKGDPRAAAARIATRRLLNRFDNLRALWEDLGGAELPEDEETKPKKKDLSDDESNPAR